MKSILKSIHKRVVRGLNLKQFGLFLLAAFIFLMLSKLSETSVEEVTFKIEIRDLPNNIQLKKDSSFWLKAKVKSSGFGFLPVSLGRLDPVILSADEDLKLISNNKYLWILGEGYENLQLKVSESLDIITTKSDSIFFSYDVLSSKTLPVKLNADVSFALGYDMLLPLELSQDSVLVIGPIKSIDSITHIETDKLDLKEIKSNIDISVALINPNDKTLSLNIAEVGVKGVVERFTEGSVTVPVRVVNVPEDVSINYFPKEISLNYYVGLESYKDISPNDFEVICDFDEHKKNGEFYLRPEIKLKSQLVKTVRANITKVDFIFLSQ